MTNNLADSISWAATIATIIAASMTAANLGSRITGYGFAVFLVGSLAWLATGLMTDQPALVWTNAVLTILNIFGIWRWLGRQARVEEGARAASEASEETPGEALFPISLLSRAAVRGEGADLGQCIDAMAGCHSGRLSYVVVSQGGIGGVGETLRRLPWAAIHVDGEEVRTRVTTEQFQALEALERDQWPAR
jgi:membrane protein implicated in regulation of membrane protease activity